MHDHSKKLAFILVLSAHAAAAMLVERALKVRHGQEPDSGQPPLLVSFLTLLPPPPPPASAGSRSGPSPGQRRREVAAVAPVAPVEPPIAAPAPSSAITDFRAQGEQAAHDAAAAAARPKPFGHEFAPAAEHPGDSVFGPKNDHPAGTVEQLDGVERHWVTDECYFDFPRLRPLQEIPGFKTMSLHCKGPVSGGTHLFKDMRPGYMTEPPKPPQPAPAQPPIAPQQH